jgi:hypothetical protein
VTKDRLRRLNNFVAFPIFMVGSAGFFLINGPARWWFLPIAVIGSLTSLFANLMVFVQNRKSEQTER